MDIPNTRIMHWIVTSIISNTEDLPIRWMCNQATRDFVKTKVGVRNRMNIQEAEGFKTSKFFCKTDFDMKEIDKEEAEYVPLPKFYTFKPRVRILYANFLLVNRDVKEMIEEIFVNERAK